MQVEQGVSQSVAEALGFPKLRYAAVEHERRWLCSAVPWPLVRQSFLVNDLYVSGTRLRLREMRPTDGGPALRKLTRKADLDAQTRLITTIYLDEQEFEVLAAGFKGERLTKLRHRLHAPQGVLVSVDEFQGELAGLVLAEAESEAVEKVTAFPMPAFATREVTDDLRYSGVALAMHGIPKNVIAG